MQRASGDLDGAVVTETAAIAQRLAISGRIHRETAVLYNTHALTLTAANRFDEAVAAYKETLDIYKQLGMDGELDAQVTLGNLGMAEYRIGHLRVAEGLLRTAYERERTLAGDSAALSAVMGLYSEVLTLTARSAQSLTVVKEAVDMAKRYAGPSSPVALRNLLFLADAEAASGDLKSARATAVEDHELALAQYGPKNLTTLRAQSSLARLELQQGETADARARLLATIEQLRGLGAAGQTSLAEALQYLGEVELATGNPAGAIEYLREARSILSRVADSGWNAAIVRERLGEALSAAHQPGAAGELNQAVSVLSAELGVTHPDTIRANTALQALGTATRGP